METHLAMFEKCLPINPIPFLTRIIELTQKNGTDHIQSDQVKALLWIILVQAYGQFAVIDLSEEYQRLKKAFKS